MIIYQRPLPTMTRSAEAALVRANPERPVAASARRAVEQLTVASWLADREHVCVLDLGARDGTTTAEIAALVGDRAPHVVVYGLDPVASAVGSAEDAHGSLRWINDTVERLPDRPELWQEVEAIFDLVIDRGYPSLLATPARAEHEAATVAALLAPGGIAIHIVSRAAYAEWSHAACAEWSRSLFEIRASVLGPGVRVDDTDCYVTFHGDGVAELGLAQTEPLPGSMRIGEIEFELDDGSRTSWYLIDNEGMQLRAWHHGVRRGALAAYRFRPPAAAPAPLQDVEAPLLELARSAWVPGRPAVLDPSGAVIGAEGRRVRYQRQLYDRLVKDGFNVLHYPRACPHVRLCLDGVDEWVAALPDLVVLGPGLIDARHDRLRDGRVVTDIDQFGHMLGWLIERLVQEARAHVAWVQFEPPPEDVLSGGVLRAPDLAAFAGVGRDVAAGHGASVHAVPYERIAPAGVPTAASAATELATIVRELVPVPVGGTT